MVALRVDEQLDIRPTSTSSPDFAGKTPFHHVLAMGIGFRSGALVLYTLFVAVAFHVRVRWFEEPWLARTHGESWVAYADSGLR